MSAFSNPAVSSLSGTLIIPDPFGNEVDPPTPEPGTAKPGVNQSRRSRGQWGELEQLPFFLEPPADLLNRFPLPNPKPRWFIPAAETSRVLAKLCQMGLPSEMVHALNHPSNRASQGDQMVFFPPLQALLHLSPLVRAAIYGELRQFDQNADIVGPVVISNRDVDSWFAGSGLRPELIAIIKRMSYPRGDALVFSDLSALMTYVQGEAEARSVLSVMTRTWTLLLHLSVEERDRAAAAAGGGRGNRPDAARPAGELMRCVAGAQAGSRIDAAHLLPPLARRLLYTFPDFSSAAEGGLPDCHWTSLNFFRPQPEPFYLDSRLAASALMERYQPVKPPYQFGDVLVFVDRVAGNAFHSCVHVADDVVFTKNGRNLLSPWVFQTMDHLRKTYLFDQNGRIEAYRQRDAAKR